ncbi:PTS sugar transporter [Sinanaerobacter chloroacetimidivorans]|uniref:PTS sugar transporter n=1 Tax=Sinanaerobacter chloroacetimidivorans TaxID=2818044 RepID=A0A8J7W4X1_9FIRM|nr:PTS sugar transporter [Sinanaerobacter chloroacetimidivorans]MBR0599101.1 PTS sugar transporter [Sinanaerobacter chloroacetimidivorans]
MSKKIAILGSSGGNLYTLGGKDPKSLLGETAQQIRAAGMEIGAIQFIAAEASMDFVKPTTKAHLWTWDGDSFGIVFSGTLEEVNHAAVEKDKKIAQLIENGEIDGLILASADPDGANKEAISAAIKTKIPTTGTGGTSMAKAQSKGLNVIAVSGTTGTTNRIRAVASISALSKHFGIKYRAAIGNAGEIDTSGSILSRISLRGILMASLPGFIAMALTLFISKIPGSPESVTKLFDVMIAALPVIVAAVASKQVSGMNEVAIVAGVVAGTLSVSGGLIGGIIGGIIAGALVQIFLMKCLQWRFPATTANIVAGGLAGLIGGLLVYFIIGPLALMAGNGIRELINMALDFSPILCGAVAGLLIWPAIIGGVYHAAILPIVMLEMEKTGNSFLGAIDMCGLVMVSAGITLANIIYPRTKDEKALAAPGFLINVVFGTFVEAAYPFMFSNKIVFGGALVSACLSGAVVGFFGVRGTAYVPSVLAPALSNNSAGFIVSMLVAAASAFVITVVANKIARAKDTKKDKEAAIG